MSLAWHITTSESAGDAWQIDPGFRDAVTVHMASTDVREDMGDTMIATQLDGGECGRMSIPRFISKTGNV